MKQFLVLFFFFLLTTSRSIGQTKVEIGTQHWTNANLDVDQFANGDNIPQAKSSNDWKIAGEKKQPAWCYYQFDANNGHKYGKLYNFYAVADNRKLCPIGWHVPSADEWQKLIYDMDKPATNLKSKSGWSSESNGTNTYNFSALPAGQVSAVNTVDFLLIGVVGYWWSSSDDRSSTCCVVKNTYKNYSTNYDKTGRTCCAHTFEIVSDEARITAEPKESGLSVRCVKK